MKGSVLSKVSRPEARPVRRPMDSMGWLFGSEIFSSAVGFCVMLHLARRLGRSGFAGFEYGSAVAAWWLVLVRGGFDTIAYREAARRPLLIRPMTDLLIGLRLASAAVGMLVVLVLAWSAGGVRGSIVAVSGLILPVSAMATDVGLRSTGRWGPLAIVSAIRSMGLAVGAWWLVIGPDDGRLAAGSVVGAEGLSSLLLIGLHGRFWPRFQRRGWLALGRRGAIAGTTRFGRVTLYAADLLALGWFSGPDLGPYAAARRVAFALLALGLIVPSAIAPKIARAWVAGVAETREWIGRTLDGLLLVVVPATVGLMFTADRWMPWLFGGDFAEGGRWLALIAARLPFVLISNVQQTALIACRREVWAFRLMMSMVGLGAFLIPILGLVLGTFGVGLAILLVEVVGSVVGWFLLRNLGLTSSWNGSNTAAVVSGLGVATLCVCGRSWPLVEVVGWSVIGALAIVFGVVRLERRRRA